MREAWQAIRPFSTGGNYVNFQVAEDDDARTTDAYRGNFERLRRVKAEYDPDNLFRAKANSRLQPDSDSVLQGAADGALMEYKGAGHHDAIRSCISSRCRSHDTTTAGRCRWSPGSSS